MRDRKEVLFYILLLLAIGVVCALFILIKENKMLKSVENYNVSGMNFCKTETLNHQYIPVDINEYRSVNINSGTSTYSSERVVAGTAVITASQSFGNLNMQSALEPRGYTSVVFNEPKLSTSVPSIFVGSFGILGGRKRTGEWSSGGAVGNIADNIDHSGINSRLKTMGLNTDMEEDPFDPGGGEDNDGQYNDVPVGDNLFILLGFVVMYVCIKYRKTIITQYTYFKTEKKHSSHL